MTPAEWGKMFAASGVVCATLEPHVMDAFVLAQARADRERLRSLGRGEAASWQDADLEGPLVALSRQLNRPNATFSLDEQTMREWEDAAAEALKEGGGPITPLLSRRIASLVTAAKLPLNDKMRTARR